MLKELLNETDYWQYIEDDTKYHSLGWSFGVSAIEFFEDEKELVEDDYMADDSYYAMFIGTVFGVYPSGKFYTPWANSNVDLLEAAQDMSFIEGLEDILEKNDMWLFSGEGDPCDLFIGKGLNE